MGKYDHLISFVPRPDRPNEKADWNATRKIAWMEESFMPGAMYFEIMWYCSPREPAPPPHTHDFDEIIGFVGGNPEDPKELGAVVKFNIGGEMYTFTQSVLITVPAGLEHSPIIVESVERPFLHFSGGPAKGSYTQNKSEG